MHSKIRNVAILAHVDAGKTTLSERILFNASEIHRPGNVEDGLATMDYLPEEKERGITIESGIAHFEWKKTWFNFIDTPGHIDFGAEVDFSLAAVENAVLVVAASSGVESQTLTAWQKLNAHKIKKFLFINKLDNPDYSLDSTLISIEETFAATPVLLSYPEMKNGKIVSVIDVLSKTRLVHNAENKEVPEKIEPDEEPEELKKYYKEVSEIASLFDDAILEDLLNERDIPPQKLLKALKKVSDSDKYIFCYAGSAKENFSVRSLMTALAFFAAEPPALNPSELGLVFRLRHFKNMPEFYLFRSHTNLTEEHFPENFSFYRMKANMLEKVNSVYASDIYALFAPSVFELGDVLNLEGHFIRKAIDIENHYQPLLQTRLECISGFDFEKVSESLSVLSRMEPSLKLEYREDFGDWLLHTVGEVQMDVLLERLKREFGCEIQAGSPDVAFIEKLKEPVLHFKNSFQFQNKEIAVDFSAEKTEGFQANQISAFGFSEEEEALIEGTLQELSAIGVFGKGFLCGAQFEIILEKRPDFLPLSMLKKVVSDAFKLSVLPQNIEVYEPYMEVFAESPVAYAGALTNDVYFRNGTILNIGGDGRFHHFYAKIPLRKLFGYATAVRSISKGTAIYSMRLYGYEKCEP